MSFSWWWLVAGVLLAAAIFDFVARMRRAPGGKVAITGDGSYGVEVVGESHYQQALRSIAPDGGYVRHECVAALILDDGNPHDRNAVRVEIGGQQVGHLSRQTARDYRAMLARKEHPRADGIVKAIVCGGGKKSYGVWLDLA